MKSFISLMQKAFFWLLCATVFSIAAALLEGVINSLMIVFVVLVVVSVIMMFLSIFTDLSTWNNK